MGTLTGQQINNTYDGLLKLADSTTGITSSFQSIEDGLGNNTGSRISTEGITSPNIVNVKTTLVPDYMGNGFGVAANAPVANTENRLVYGMFYDTGVHSYSAITYNLNRLSSTSDVVNFYFYSLQLGTLVGIGPKDLIMSGITLESSVPSVTGITTTVLPSTLSFSGTGGGWYIYAYYISNSGVTPTVRYNQPMTPSHVQGGIPLNPLGNYITVTQNSTGVGSRYLQFVNAGTPITINNLAVQPSYSENDILINTILNIGTPSLGFSLNVIK